MTLLELAHYTGKTIQILCDEIKHKAGLDLPCKSNTIVENSVVQVVVPTFFKSKKLSEVAKELNVGILTIIEFFEKNNINITSNPNTRISDENYQTLYNVFKNEREKKIKSQELFKERQKQKEIQLLQNNKHRTLLQKKQAQSIKDSYDSLSIGKKVDVIIDEIIDNTESRYIKVKYNNLFGVIFLNDLFWCSRVSDINNHLKTGETIKAKVVSKETKDGNFRVRFSHKEFTTNPWNNSFYEGQEVRGSITEVNENFFTIKIAKGVEGRLYQNDMTRFEFESLKYWETINDDINLAIKSIDKDNHKIYLYIPIREDIYDIWDNIHEYYEVGKTYKGNFISRDAYNLWVQLEDGIEASVNNNEITWKNSSTDTISNLSFGKPLNVLITNVDKEKRKIFASLKQITPNPWDIAKTSISIGDICKVKIIAKRDDALVVETQDNLHLIGKIKPSEISWFPLTSEEDPQIGWTLEAKIILFLPEKFTIQFSIKQLQEDPWNNLYQGATVDGEILEKIDDSFLSVRIHNGLVAKTSELDLAKYIGETYPFKIVNFNRASQEIIVNHLSLITDKQNEEIIKSFFNSSII